MLILILVALRLGPATSYAYLNSGNCCTINGVDDADEFRSVMVGELPSSLVYYLTL